MSEPARKRGVANLHSVLARTSGETRPVKSVEFVVDFYVEVSLVLAVGFAGKETCHGFAFLDSEDFANVENSLLPVSVFRVWPG